MPCHVHNFGNATRKGIKNESQEFCSLQGRKGSIYSIVATINGQLDNETVGKPVGLISF